MGRLVDPTQLSFCIFEGLEFINWQRVRLVDPAQWAASPLDKSPAHNHQELLLLYIFMVFMTMIIMIVKH